MKKCIALFLAMVSFVSCSEDVKFNNPSFQGYRDGILFRGVEVKAYKSTSTGAIQLVGLAQDEELTIDLSAGATGTYYLGTTNTATKAIYSSSFNGDLLRYETAIVNGPVADIAKNFPSAGSGYTPNCITVNGATTCSGSYPTTGGSGSGLTLSISTNTAGAVTAVKVASPGNNYKAGDLITIVGGNNNAKVRVLNVEGSNGEVIVTENDGNLISGSFKFNAVQTTTDPTANEIVNFQYGSFYKVPIYPAP
jgi:hypothetical protein